MRLNVQKKGILICLTGIDGSGKTTLSRLLLRILHTNGIACGYVWCGWKQFESPMLQKLVFLANKFLFRGKEKKASYLSANSLALRFPKIFTSLVLMDYLQKVTVHVSIPLKFGHNIICDRYAYDAVASLGINLGYSFDTINRILGILLRLLPKPSLVFLVDTPAEYALRRKSDILSVSNLMRLKNILESLRPLGMLSIDGTRSLNQQTEFFGEILGLKA